MLFFISGIGWCRILQVLRAEPSRRLDLRSDNGEMGATLGGDFSWIFVS